MRIATFVRILLIVSIIGIIAVMPGCDKNLLVLYFSDSDNNFAGEALDRMNYAYTRTYSLFDFYNAFDGGEWDLVVFDNRHPEIVPVMEPIAEALFYFEMMGGKLILSSCYLPEDDYAILWAELGYEWKTTATTPINVYRINPADELWTEPNNVPDLNLSGVTDLYGSAANAFKGAAWGPGLKVATFNQAIPGDLNSGAVFKSNSGRTYVNSFFLDDAVVAGEPVDSDDDGLADAVEWYMNELAALERVEGQRVKIEIDV